MEKTKQDPGAPIEGILPDHSLCCADLGFENDTRLMSDAVEFVLRTLPSLEQLAVRTPLEGV